MTDRLCSLDPLLQRVLDAAAAPAEAPLPGEEAALAAFRALTGPGRRRRFSHPARVAAASAFGAVVMASGVAAAANGSLPLLSHHAAPAATAAIARGDAADHASSGARRAEGREGGAGASAHRLPGATPTHPTSSTPPGAAVATVAHQAPAQGPGTGPAVCAVASAGSCQAGTHGKATTGSTPARGRSSTSQRKKGAAPGKGAHAARAHHPAPTQGQGTQHAAPAANHRPKPPVAPGSAGH